MKEMKIVFCIIVGVFLFYGCTDITQQMDIYHGEEKIIAIAVTGIEEKRTNELIAFINEAFISSAETTVRPIDAFEDSADYQIDMYPFASDSGQDTVSIWISIDGEQLWFIRTGWAEMETKYIWQASCSTTEFLKALQNYGG